MITHDEMVKFSKMLDEEYKNDILPMVIKAQNAIDSITSVVYCGEFQTMRKRVGYDTLKIGHLPESIQRAIGNFGYFGDSCNEYQLFHHKPSTSIISYLGYSVIAYGVNGGVWDILCRGEKFIGNDALRVSYITDLKKRFNNIKDAYHSFFVENDGEMFKRFADFVLAHCKRVKEADKVKDNEIHALFNDNTPIKNIKITVVIEGM